jgi:hypothetical protein
MKNNKNDKRGSKNQKPVTKQQVKQMLNANVPDKYIDTPFSYSVTNPGTLVTINLPGVQGIANGQRTGDEIEIIKIEIREQINVGDSTGNLLRVCYFQCRGPTTLGSIGDLWANGVGGIPTVTSQYQSWVDKTYLKILSDITHSLSATGYTQVISHKHTLSNVIKRVAFNSGSSTPSTGQPQVYLLSDSFITPNPKFEAVVRVWYRDV